MILNRLGNKKKIARKIQRYFPKHSIYMEPFFGAGGMYFNKQKVQYNYVNDIDTDVYNLFRQLLDNKEELIYWLKKVPITQKQFDEWSHGKRENTEVGNAVRFLILSNYGMYGKCSTLRVGTNYPKTEILKHIDITFDYLQNTYFLNTDFRNFFKKCSNVFHKNTGKCFCYCDPPYLGTDNNYSTGFTEKDSEDLFDLLQESGIKFAISEFNQPFILKQAKIRGLNVVIIGERTNLKNKNTEILVTNYKNHATLF